MTVESGSHLPSNQFPQNYRFINTRRRQGFAIRAKCKGIDSSRVGLESINEPSRLQTPKSDSLITPSRG